MSVVVRVKNEAPAMSELLANLAAQTIADRSQVIVVDSGSTDGTVDVVRRADAQLIEIPPEDFTYGYALNLGCAEAEAPVIIALSAHAFPCDEHWLAHMLDVFEDERVACACGYDRAPDGGELTEQVLQDAEHAHRYPRFGYSNASGAFRAALWRERPFREDMPASEDKEWALHWLDRGWLCLVDPALAVAHDHGGESAALTYQRAFREYESLPMYTDVRPCSALEMGREWWRGDPAWRSRFRALISWRRALQLLGKYRGLRAGAAAR